MKEFATVRLSYGRLHLNVAGFTLAMEGDKCRDGTLPEEVLPPIPEEELAVVTIGDKPAKDLPISIVRWFRGDCWTKTMLEYVANEINKRVAAGTWPDGRGATYDQFDCPYCGTAYVYKKIQWKPIAAR